MGLVTIFRREAWRCCEAGASSPNQVATMNACYGAAEEFLGRSISFSGRQFGYLFGRKRTRIENGIREAACKVLVARK